MDENAPKVTTQAPAAAPTISAASDTSSPMRGLISTLTGGVILGETDTGAAWTLKALHPADSSVLASPMPTNETRSFASVSFTQMNTFSIPFTFDTTKPWGLEIYLFRDPVLLYSYRYLQSGKTPVVGYQYSTQYGAESPGYNDSFQALRTKVEKFRVTSHSLTGYFDGASESDQGHLVLAQSDLPWYRVPATMTPPPLLDVAAHIPWVFYQDRPPVYDVLLQGTRAYQGSAKMGFYAPSKLNNLGRWITTNQTNGMLGSAVNEGIPPPGTVPFETLGKTSLFSDAAILAFQGTFPYMKNAPGDPIPFVFDQADSAITTVIYTGLASGSTLRFTMRWTMDMMVRPGTVYSPFVRMPPVEDHTALRMYAEVSRRMADGYPSAYNALGAILPIIGKIASAVLPSIANLAPSWFQAKADAQAHNIAAGKRVVEGPGMTDMIIKTIQTMVGQHKADQLDHKLALDPYDTLMATTRDYKRKRPPPLYQPDGTLTPEAVEPKRRRRRARQPQVVVVQAPARTGGTGASYKVTTKRQRRSRR